MGRRVRPGVGPVVSAALLVLACAPGRNARGPDAEATRSVAPAENQAAAAASEEKRPAPQGGAPSGELRPEQGTAQPNTEGTSGTPPAASRQALLEQAQAQLLEVASSDFSNVRERTSRLLYTLADLASASDAGAEEQRHVQEIRFQAERIERTDASFARSEWVERALLAALAVLEGSADAARNPDLDGWITTARDATQAIPDHSSLAFEEGPLQDALRATVSAYAAARMAHGGAAPEHTASEGP
jgi:hypothetical protein